MIVAESCCGCCATLCDSVFLFDFLVLNSPGIRRMPIQKVYQSLHRIISSDYYFRIDSIESLVHQKPSPLSSILWMGTRDVKLILSFSLLSVH